jgi:hypothetical protein
MTAPKKNRTRAVAALGGSGENMPYLCWVIGRSSDVRIHGLASRLGVSKAAAVGLVVMWEELVYFHGEASGRVPDLTMRDVAAALGADERKLQEAMAEARLLVVSGRGKERRLRHPTWARSRSGNHIREREETKSYWREKKREERRLAKEAAARAVAAQLAAAAVSAGEGGGRPEVLFEVSNGRPLDISGTSSRRPWGVQTTRKEGRNDIPIRNPPDPPQGGGGLGQQRWRELRPLFERPMNDDSCEALLAEFTPQEWDLCLWVLAKRNRAALLSLSRKKSAFRRSSFDFLRLKLFTQFEPDRARQQAIAPAVPLAVETEQKERRRLYEIRKLVTDWLLDPDMPQEEKERRKSGWLKAHPTQREWLDGWTTAPHPITEETANGVH